MKKQLSRFLFILVLSSCASKKDLLYFQDAENSIPAKIEYANKGDFERKLLMLDSIYCNLEKALQIIHKGE